MTTNDKTQSEGVPSPGAAIRVPRKMARIAVSRLPLSTRLDKAFRDRGIQVLGHLHGKTFEDFRGDWNFGAKTERELSEIVESVQNGRIGRPRLLGRKTGSPETHDQFEIPAHSRRVAVSTLDISPRLANALGRLQIRCLGDLVGCEPADFLSHVNFGERSLIELYRLEQRARAGEFNPEGAEVAGLRPVDIVPLLEALVGELEDRDGVIMQRRYGAASPAGQTLCQIGASLRLTRERIRQIVEKSLIILAKKGGPKLAHLVARMGADCDEAVCPLSPALLEAWLKGSKVRRKFNAAFYVRLLASLAPELPIWLDDPLFRPSNDATGEAGCAALEACLRKGSGKVLLKNGFTSLCRQREFKDLTPRAFLEAIRRSTTLSATFDRPDQPALCLRKA